MSVKEKLRIIWAGLKVIPYKWAWLALMICLVALFSWWDEFIVWGLGITWKWWIVPLYYVVEYCVMLPLTLLLMKKTYDKLNMKVSPRKMMMEALKSSVFMKVYRKLRGSPK